MEIVVRNISCTNGVIRKTMKHILDSTKTPISPRLYTFYGATVRQTKLIKLKGR